MRWNNVVIDHTNVCTWEILLNDIYISKVLEMVCALQQRTEAPGKVTLHRGTTQAAVVLHGA